MVSNCSAAIIVKMKETVPTEKIKIEWKRLLNYQWIVRNISFFLFLAVLAVIYIYNGHMLIKPHAILIT